MTSIDSPAFACGVVPEAIGISVSVLNKEKHRNDSKRPKKDSALIKHRRWLQELHETKDKLEIEYATEMQMKQEARERVSVYRWMEIFKCY